MATPSRAGKRRISPFLTRGRLPIHHRGTNVAPMCYSCLPMPPPTLLSVTEADFSVRLTRPNRCILVTPFAILLC